MSMNNEQDQSDKLCLLLSLKRYEQPPPGFFNRLSSDIMSQVRATRGRDEVALEERLAFQVPWLQRFWQMLESKPLFAGSFGVAVCGLMLAGIAYHTAPEPSPAPIIPVTSLASGTEQNISPAFPSSFNAQLPNSAPVPTLVATAGVWSLGPAPVQRHPDVFTVGDQR